jgi:hypothetical protein
MADMRSLKEDKAPPAFGPCEECLIRLLEQIVHVAPDERRAPEGAESTTAVVRPTALAPSLPQLRQRVIEMMQADDNMAAQLAIGEAKVPSSLSALATRICPTHAEYSKSMRVL